MKTNLTNTPMVQETATVLSPEGDKLAGVNNITGVMYVMDADGSDIVPLQPGARTGSPSARSAAPLRAR